MKLEDERLEHDVIYDFSYVPYEALLALNAPEWWIHGCVGLRERIEGCRLRNDTHARLQLWCCASRSLIA